jgi:hypothetical protein
MYQAQILFLYQHEDGFLSYSFIKEQLGMDDANLIKNLSVLVLYR